MTTSELAALAAQRDREAFDTLIRRHRPEVLSIIRARVQNEDRADEITQDACVRAWTKIHQCTDHALFIPWLVAIAINVMRDANRRTTRHQRHLQYQASRGLQWMTVGPGDQSALQPLVSSSRNAALEAALLSLTEKTREAFVMHYGEDMSYDEIAERLNISRGAVKLRVHRACQALRKVIQRQGKCDVF